MDDVMTDELQQMFDELRELMEQIEDGDKEQIEQQLEQMDLDQESLEQELDRALEQFKQLQWEQKMEEAISDLEKLAEEQEALAKETEEGNTPEEELAAKQDSLNKEFDKVQEALEDAEKLNKELENPNNVPMMEELQEEIQQDMDGASEDLDSGKEKKASEKQKKAAGNMSQMAQQMQSSMEAGEQESMEEDMEALRALLENIITLSFDEEDLMSAVGDTRKDDPRYVAHGQDQRKLKDDAEMVKDSLFALSKRVTQLQAIVNREINLVNLHMEQALEGFTDRETGVITSNQQYVMTSFNNLALLLDEVLQQMQNQSSCNKPGTGNCEKPGGSGSKPSPSAKQIKGMQQSLSKQLEQMKKKMQGFNQGEGKDGKRQLSKELAQMAAQQAAIRQMTQELGKQLNEDGSGTGNGLEQIAKEMEELEKDIVNGELDQLSLDRQQNILTRLLQAENAERIRGEKEERESKTAQDVQREKPPSLEEYEQRKAQEIELLRTVPADLTPYYKDRVNDYFNTLDIPERE
jgi:chromosome segregation ATPase